MARKALCPAVLPALLLAIALLLGGCGAKSQDPKEMLATAVQAARDAGSAHARLNVSISPLEGEKGMGLNVQGDAWLDMDAGVMDTRFTVMGMELSLRYVETTAYLQFGGKWYVLTADILEGVGEETIAAAVDALSSIPEVISSGTEATAMGDEKVGGFSCTRMEVVPDPRAIAALEPVAKLAAELDMSPDELVDYLEEADVEMEVCVQKDEPVIREVYLAASVKLPSIGDLVGIPLLPDTARVEITMYFTEYGVSVDVRAPTGAEPFKGS